MKLKTEWFIRFQQEARTHLGEIDEALKKLDWKREGQARSAEEKEAEASQIKPLFVKAHNIKGTAAMLGLEELAAKAMELETLWWEAVENPDCLNESLRAKAEADLIELNRMVEAIQPSEVNSTNPI
ncbi:MAG TPA: Hpt domain-containing protein [Chloroflexia bacterium]|nr:Hpt domain-containing protein [Chloroflexia bacterium]